MDTKAQREICNEVEALRLAMGVKEADMAGVLMGLSAFYAQLSGIREYEFSRLSREAHRSQGKAMK